MSTGAHCWGPHAGEAMIDTPAWFRDWISGTMFVDWYNDSAAVYHRVGDDYRTLLVCLCLPNENLRWFISRRVER